MCVRTLGGAEKDITGRVFNCWIQDLKGRVYQFKAHSLDKVTGKLGDIPTALGQVLCTMGAADGTL